MAFKDFAVKNGIDIANSSFTANSTVVKFGSLITINTTAISIGNSTSNAVLTQNSFIMNSAPFGTILTANNTDANTYYIPMANSYTGTWSNAVVSSTKLSFIPSTGFLTCPIFATGNLTTTISANIAGHYIDSTSATFIGTVSTAKAHILYQTLTDAATIAWDTSLGQIATVTLGANRVVGNPTNLKVGTYILHVIQDATGGRTLTWGSAFKWPAGVAPVLTTAANRHDIFSFICDGTSLFGSFLPDVR